MLLGSILQLLDEVYLPQNHFVEILEGIVGQLEIKIGLGHFYAHTDFDQNQALLDDLSSKSDRF